MNNNVGMLLTPNFLDVSGLSSTFTFTIFTRPSYSLAISSRTGPIARQGPHQGAQKSTRAGQSDFLDKGIKRVVIGMDYIFFVSHLSLLTSVISFAQGFFLMIKRSHPMRLDIYPRGVAVIDLDQRNEIFYGYSETDTGHPSFSRAL